MGLIVELCLEIFKGGDEIALAKSLMMF